MKKKHMATPVKEVKTEQMETCFSEIPETNKPHMTVHSDSNNIFGEFCAATCMTRAG